MKRFSVLFSLILHFLIFSAANANAQQGSGVGWVTSLTGNVYAQNSDTSPKAPLSMGQEIHNGMIIVTEKRAAARILFQGDNVLTISQNTKIKITRYISNSKKTDSSFELLWGRIRAAVVSRMDEHKGDRFEIRTNNAVAGVRGSLLGVGYEQKRDETKVGCGEGKCYATIGGQMTGGQVTGGQTTVIPAGRILTILGEKWGSPVPLQWGDPGHYSGINQYDDDGNNGNPADKNIPGSSADANRFKNLFRTPRVDYDPLNMDYAPNGPGTIYDPAEGGGVLDSDGFGSVSGPGE